ncbi:hypothetical protein QR680_012931 [Steinernema hermaphroditum]|nr:hypothetical protein QR680_012931 [Steinernema hermaphroditum]
MELRKLRLIKLNRTGVYRQRFIDSGRQCRNIGGRREIGQVLLPLATRQRSAFKCLTQSSFTDVLKYNLSALLGWSNRGGFREFLGRSS